MITVPTKDIYNVKDVVTIISSNLGDIKNRWIGDNNYGLEKRNIEYMKRGFKL